MTMDTKEKGVLARRCFIFSGLYIRGMNKSTKIYKKTIRKGSLLKTVVNYWDNWKILNMDYILDI